MYSRLLTALIASAPLAFSWSAFCQDSVGFGEVWDAEISFSYANWSNLGDIEPAGRGGPFETDGFGYDAGIEGSVTRWGTSLVLVGFNLGMSGFNSNVYLEGFEDTSSLDLFYANGTATFRFGEKGEQYFDVDVGLGWYMASNMYIDCMAIPDCFQSEINVSRPGGFLGISGAVWRGLTLGARVHYADFGTIDSIGPDSGPLAGPIYTAYLGWEFGNWFR